MNNPVRTEPAGPKPPPVEGHEWRVIDVPNHGTCDADWEWALFKNEDVK